MAGRPYLSAGDWADRRARGGAQPQLLLALRLPHLQGSRSRARLVGADQQLVRRPLRRLERPPGRRALRPGCRRIGWGWTGPPASLVPLAAGKRRHHPLRLRRCPHLLAGGPRPRWTGDGRARAYLSQAGFLRDEVQRKGEVSAVYARDGTIVEQRPQPGRPGRGPGRAAHPRPAAGPRPVRRPPGRPGDRLAGRAGPARRPAGRQPAPACVPAGRSPDDLYTQDWAWFSTALYAGALPDLWHVPSPPVTSARRRACRGRTA